MAAKKTISSLVSRQIHKDHYSYNDLSDEIQQKHHNDVPTTEANHRLVTEQYEDQDNDDME